MFVARFVFYVKCKKKIEAHTCSLQYIFLKIKYFPKATKSICSVKKKHSSNNKQRTGNVHVLKEDHIKNIFDKNN